MPSVVIDEVFASLQGEGVRAGQRHIFVRFVGCDLRCRYCDTPAAIGNDDGPGRLCRAQRTADSFAWEPVENPVGPEQLTALCSRLAVPGPGRPVVSLTGGEPLLQEEFLARWLPDVHGRFLIMFETNGIHHKAMASLAPLADIVSMDMKLPSATGQRERWSDHERFLAAAGDCELSVKAVVTRGTSIDDVLHAARLTAAADPSLPFILQPASGEAAPPTETMLAMQRAALEQLADVRILPQLHRLLSVP